MGRQPALTKFPDDCKATNSTFFLFFFSFPDIEKEFRNEQDRLTRLRAEGVKAKGNKQSVPYDPLTLKYKENLDGLKLKNEDDFVRIYMLGLHSFHPLTHSFMIGTIP